MPLKVPSSASPAHHSHVRPHPLLKHQALPTTQTSGPAHHSLVGPSPPLTGMAQPTTHIPDHSHPPPTLRFCPHPTHMLSPEVFFRMLTSLLRLKTTSSTALCRRRRPSELCSSITAERLVAADDTLAESPFSDDFVAPSDVLGKRGITCVFTSLVL